MAQRRWTVLLVPHGSASTRSFAFSGTVLKLAVGVATVVAASMLAATIGVVSHSVDVSRSRHLEKANQALASEVARLGQRVGTLSDTLAVISRRDEEVRLVAGLEPLSPDVRRAGIGGPSGPWPERERLLNEGGSVGRAAFGVHTDLDAMIRRANLLATSFKEAADSLQTHTQEMAATPSIMPTQGFLTSKFSFIRYHPILHESRPHEGIDITAAYGSQIIAPAAGRVVKVGLDDSPQGVIEFGDKTEGGFIQLFDCMTAREHACVCHSHKRLAVVIACTRGCVAFCVYLSCILSVVQKFVYHSILYQKSLPCCNTFVVELIITVSILVNRRKINNIYFAATDSAAKPVRCQKTFASLRSLTAKNPVKLCWVTATLMHYYADKFWTEDYISLLVRR